MGKAKVIVQMSKSGNVYNGSIVALAAGVQNSCSNCSYKGSLMDLKVLSGLQDIGVNRYDNGRIF